MACTTILVGKKASFDGSTIIARNDDSPSGVFTAKKMVVYKKEDKKKVYKSVLSHVEIPLPDYFYDYTAMPNVDKSEGLWLASGINEKNVAMSATETITSNPRVLGSDPYVVLKKEKGKEIPGGIGEEDLVRLVLPYIKTAKEGVIRLGELLQQYGTYEPNGIAFSDENEIWWLETIGGHHFIAKKVPDDRYVVMPNQFGLDNFDFKDAFSKQEENICSSDLLEFIKKNHLDLNLDGEINPRICFGSKDDSDHTYNTPRAWYMLRHFNPNTFKWDGDCASYTPYSDDLPWSMVPEYKITIEDVKYILSSHYQGTDYDCYNKNADPLKKGMFRPIGISRTSFLAISQIRPYVKDEIKAIEWISFASNVFNCSAPVYARCKTIPSYYGNTTLKVSTDNLYWTARLISQIADNNYNTTSIFIERYQNAVASKSWELINKFDKEIVENHFDIDKANEEIASMVKEESDKTLSKVLYTASCHMKNGFNRSDN